MRQVLAPIASDVAVNDVRVLRQFVDRAIAPRRFVVWLLGGFAGVAWLVPAGKIDPRGAGLLGMACVSWAIGSLVARTAPFPPSKLLATSMQMLAGGALQVVAGLAIGEAKEVVAPSAGSWAAWGYLVVFGSWLGFTSYVQVLHRLPTNIAMTYSYVNPAIAVVLGWAILGEALSPSTVLGVALVLAGVAGVFRDRTSE